MSDQKQLFQVQNILETLLEATDHFSDLIKKRELNQSIYAFSSIVEGTQVIIPALLNLDEDFKKQTEQLEKSILLIADHLEKGNLGKIAEILQFSLRPRFIKLTDLFISKFGNQKADKMVRIGVFNSWRNPREFYTEDRVNAMVDEATKQDATLYFFTSDDIDLDTKQIKADTYENKEWVRVTTSFPDVIENAGAGKKSQAERELSRLIPFTNFHVGNKYTLPKRMLKYRKYSGLLVPFKVCANEQTINNFLENNKRVVFKALGSNRGENIYFITKKGSRYVMTDQKKERILSSEEFNQFVEHTILKEKNSYIVQKYIHTRTKDDEPYHFRAHVQKNGEGRWQLTHIYPRIGSKKSNLSNITTEGRVEDFSVFLQNEYGDKSGSEYEEIILQLSVDVAGHLDKLYGLIISELGIDFAIDDTGKIWMHEANNGPQTAYHEEKRALNTIAYAKYIAENGVMYSTTSENNQFQVQYSDLPYAVVKNHSHIGMMTGKINEKLTQTLHEKAEETELDFFYFHLNDIDFDRELIKGYFFENNEWTPKVTSYPDVIIDYVKLRGKEDTNYIYEELRSIPYTNPWPQYTKIRSNIYNQLQQDDVITEILPAFEKIIRPYDVIRFMNQHHTANIKPESTNFVNYHYFIEHIEGNTYEVTRGNKKSTLSENTLKNNIKELIKEKNYIIQANPLENNSDEKQVKMHLMLNGNNEWDLVEINGTLEDEAPVFKQAVHIAEYCAAANEGLISEIILDVIIEDNQTIQLQEIDFSGTVPAVVEDNESAIAEITIEYAASLI